MFMPFTRHYSKHIYRYVLLMVLRETGRPGYESTVAIRSGGPSAMMPWKIFGQQIEYIYGYIYFYTSY